MDHETDAPLVEEIDLADIAAAREAARAKMQGHAWRQMGNMIECSSCPFAHGFALEPGHLMTGINENGFPIIETLDEYNHKRYNKAN